MSLPWSGETPIFPFHRTHLIRGRVPELARGSPTASFLSDALHLPKMHVGGQLPHNFWKENQRTFSKPLLELRTLGLLLPMLGWKRGLCKRETHHFPKQALTAGRGRRVSEPHTGSEGASGPEGFYAWDGGSHLGWLGRVGPRVLPLDEGDLRCCENTCNLAAQALHNAPPTLGDPFSDTWPSPHKLW